MNLKYIGNPLSAILQCADTVITSLGEHKNLHTTTSDNEQLQSAIEASVDAAQTILLCASHQKRVVDDILTMSKLDSTRLMITPVDVMPEALVQEAMKMFEQESLMHDIKLFMEVRTRINLCEPMINIVRSAHLTGSLISIGFA